MKPAIAALVVACCCLSLPAGEEVTLQQGVSPTAQYSGCRSATLWPKAPTTAPATGDKVLHLRGENNRMLLKFDLPADLKGKTLARARLWVFLPSARNQDRYCEIMSHGMLSAWDKSATWTNAAAGTAWKAAGGDLDAQTDYQNGRPPGAADSVELYAPSRGNWYNLMDWLTVGVPEGGMWAEFNVTPLAEKWLADPASNFGVMLMPVRVQDKRMPNNWVIDIPSETYDTDARVRPKLQLEFAPPAEPVQVGMTHTLRKVNPWSWRYAYRGGFARQYLLEMAANEFEGFQVVVYPWMKDLADMEFAWGDLVDAKSGKRLPADRMVCLGEDTLQMVESWLVRDKYFAAKRYWVPDALVPADLAPARCKVVRRQQASPFWFRVHAPAGTPPGDYRTTITMTAKGAEPVKLDLTVRVWDYEIPKKWNFCIVGSFGEGNVPKFYGSDYKPEWVDRWYDFLLDQRLAPTHQYSSVLSPPANRLQHCVDRGMNVLYLDGSFKLNSDLKALKAKYDRVREMGLIDLAGIYVEDEGHRHEMRRHLALNVRKVAPEAMMMVGAGRPAPRASGTLTSGTRRLTSGRGRNSPPNRPARSSRIARGAGSGSSGTSPPARPPPTPTSNWSIPSSPAGYTSG